MLVEAILSSLDGVIYEWSRPANPALVRRGADFLRSADGSFLGVRAFDFSARSLCVELWRHRMPLVKPKALMPAELLVLYSDYGSILQNFQWDLLDWIKDGLTDKTRLNLLSTEVIMQCNATAAALKALNITQIPDLMAITGVMPLARASTPSPHPAPYTESEWRLALRVLAAAGYISQDAHSGVPCEDFDALNALLLKRYHERKTDSRAAVFLEVATAILNPTPSIRTWINGNM